MNMGSIGFEIAEQCFDNLLWELPCIKLIPNFQACHKIGMGHWNWEEPYPYGYEEFVVTCKRCSIDLEMFKLVNRLI